VLPVASVKWEASTQVANELRMNKQETMIQAALAEYLNSRKTSNAATPHIDQDTLAAFSEGTLNARESQPVVSHLVDCSFCRHITAELVRLDLELAGETVEFRAETASSQPTKISEVLSGLFAKMFGTTENTVFAHREEEEKKDEEESKEE
jgi:hypothetical protein